MYLPRTIENAVKEAIENFPVTAIIGPRQCGKSTLVKHITSNMQSKVLYLDLERPSDLQKLENAEWFLSTQKPICKKRSKT
jgi:predicted AAA+ superfamily ATPase